MKKFLIGVLFLCVLAFGFGCKSKYIIDTFESKIVNKQIYTTTGYTREVIYVSFVDIGNDGFEVNPIISELLYCTVEIDGIILVERKKGNRDGSWSDKGVYIIGWDYTEDSNSRKLE